MKLCKILPLLDFYDETEIVIKDEKNKVFYQTLEEYKLDMLYIYKYLGSYKVQKISYFTNTKAVVIIVKKKNNCIC